MLAYNLLLQGVKEILAVSLAIAFGSDQMYVVGGPKSIAHVSAVRASRVKEVNPCVSGFSVLYLLP